MKHRVHHRTHHKHYWGAISTKHRSSPKKPHLKGSSKKALKTYRKEYMKWYNNLPEVKAKKRTYSGAKSRTLASLKRRGYI